MTASPQFQPKSVGMVWATNNIKLDKRGLLFHVARSSEVGSSIVRYLGISQVRVVGQFLHGSLEFLLIVSDGEEFPASHLHMTMSKHWKK